MSHSPRAYPHSLWSREDTIAFNFIREELLWWTVYVCHATCPIRPKCYTLLNSRSCAATVNHNIAGPYHANQTVRRLFSILDSSQACGVIHRLIQPPNQAPSRRINSLLTVLTLLGIPKFGIS